MAEIMKVCVLGRHGLIGGALEKKLITSGHVVSSYPTKETKLLFHFGSTVHPPFEENPDYHIQEILSSFMYLLPFCRDNGIRFVYPSSALVYEKNTVFAKCKKIMELYASCYPDTLGVRIFPVYGPGEHRTAISQWCEAMKRGERPVIYGDGTQERDFIYIDDVVDQITDLVNYEITGIRDVGAGKPVSFNSIVATINKVLGTDLKPIYKEAPKGYSKGIVCERPGVIKVSMEEGIRKILNV